MQKEASLPRAENHLSAGVRLGVSAVRKLAVVVSP